MKMYKTLINICIAMGLLLSGPGVTTLQAQSQAGGLFLLIPPGARAGGMGEAQLAVANDVYATYYNPAGLAFQENHEIAGMHMNWLPGLVDDIYYEFVAYRGEFDKIGNIGLSFTYMNLGEQVRTGLNSSMELDRFTSYAWSAGFSYGRHISSSASLGATVKLYRQFLAPQGSLEELNDRDGAMTNVAFDIAFLTHRFLSDRISFGAVLSNLGPSISFIDENQADPAPTSFRIGMAYDVLTGSTHSLQMVYDAGQMIATRTETGEPVSFFQSLFSDGTGEGVNQTNSVLHNFGMEYWFRNMLAIRAGGLYQESGDIRTQNGLPMPTFGAGLRFGTYGFDFGYLAGNDDHPLSNTMRFSVNLGF